MHIIGYTYCADIHCGECAARDAERGILKRVPPIQTQKDEHGLTSDLVDREGNEVYPVYEIDDMGEGVATVSCGDCHAIIWEAES